MSIPPQPPSSPGPYGQSGQSGSYGYPGPPGQPGQPPYGGAPQGWYPPQQQKNNPLAIVAFVMALVCNIPLIPLILGIVALSQIKSRGEKGKGFAIAAIVINSLGIVSIILIVALGLTGSLGDDDAPLKRDTTGPFTGPAATGPATPGPATKGPATKGPSSAGVTEIRKGDCFNTKDDLAQYGDGDGTQAARSVSIVPCTQPHKGEAYAVFKLDAGTYPGNEKVIKSAEEKCSGTALTSYVGNDPKVSEKLEVYYYYPQAASWLLGDREVTCFVGDPSGPTTGSIRASGS
ncbi:septum formation family protein [Streptomyces sp. NBC_00853]|uniref:DUF4190 domain-containing protein n=1 Tax=Streptomyces sp. NBC_00853 TaxID=2903681 RepID=UPI0038736576|nr:septum formation family protein [Streptomyces sp. NBC_00853]